MSFIVGTINDTMSILDIILLLIFTIFIYRGSKVAIVGMMIYWTLNKAFQIVALFASFNQNNNAFFILFWTIFWWSVMIELLWNAYQVERARNKQKY